MGKLQSIFAICIVLCCLYLPIHAFNSTRSFYGQTGVTPLFAGLKDHIFAISFEDNIITMTAVDGGIDYNLCSLSSSPMEINSNKNQVKTLGNGKIVVSVQTGKDEHQGGKLHTYIIVDPFDCSSLVEIKSFDGLIVPYHDSFDIVYWSNAFKPHRYNDKGKLIKLEKQFDKLEYNKYNMQTIKPFDESEGYLCEGQELLSLDSEMKPKSEHSLHSDRVSSIDYGRATTCYMDRNASYGTCELLNANLQVQATVILNDLKDARLYLVSNLPSGGAAVVWSTHVPDVETFHAIIINADGNIGRSDGVIRETIHETKTQGFVLNNDKFCIVAYGKNENYKNMFNRDPDKTVVTACIDLRH